MVESSFISVNENGEGSDELIIMNIICSLFLLISDLYTDMYL